MKTLNEDIKSGSFKPVFLCGIVLCAAAGMTVLRLQKYGKDSASD